MAHVDKIIDTYIVLLLLHTTKHSLQLFYLTDISLNDLSEVTTRRISVRTCHYYICLHSIKGTQSTWNNFSTESLYKMGALIDGRHIVYTKMVIRVYCM